MKLIQKTATSCYKKRYKSLLFQCALDTYRPARKRAYILRALWFAMLWRGDAPAYLFEQSAGTIGLIVNAGGYMIASGMCDHAGALGQLLLPKLLPQKLVDWKIVVAL